MGCSSSSNASQPEQVEVNEVDPEYSRLCDIGKFSYAIQWVEKESADGVEYWIDAVYAPPGQSGMFPGGTHGVIAKGAGLIGKAGSSQQLQYEPNVQDQKARFIRRALAAQAGIKGVLAFPVEDGKKLIELGTHMEMNLKGDVTRQSALAALLSGDAGLINASFTLTSPTQNTQYLLDASMKYPKLCDHGMFVTAIEWSEVVTMDAAEYWVKGNYTAQPGPAMMYAGKSSNISLAKGVGGVGKAGSSGKAVFLENASTASNAVFRRTELAATCGIKSIVFLPLDNSAVVMELASYKELALVPGKEDELTDTLVEGDPAKVSALFEVKSSVPNTEWLSAPRTFIKALTDSGLFAYAIEWHEDVPKEYHVKAMYTADDVKAGWAVMYTANSEKVEGGKVTMMKGVGLVGRAGLNNKVQALTNAQLCNSSMFRRVTQAKDSGIKGVMCIPINEDTVMEVGSFMPLKKKPDDDFEQRIFAALQGEDQEAVAKCFVEVFESMGV